MFYTSIQRIGTKIKVVRGRSVSSPSLTVTEDPAESLRASVSRSRASVSTAVRVLAESYGVKKLRFVTFTYRENERDLTVLRRDLTATMRRLRKLRPDLRAVFVFERQKRGAWHAHAIIGTCTPLGALKLHQAWRGGYVDSRRISLDTVDKVVGYLVKYMSKTFDDIGSGQNRYRTFGNLKAEKIILKGVESSNFSVPDSWLHLGTFNGVYLKVYKFEDTKKPLPLDLIFYHLQEQYEGVL